VLLAHQALYLTLNAASASSKKNFLAICLRANKAMSSTNKNAYTSQHALRHDSVKVNPNGMNFGVSALATPLAMQLAGSVLQMQMASANVSSALVMTAPLF
jgi:hypothetical protein